MGNGLGESQSRVSLNKKEKRGFRLSWAEIRHAVRLVAEGTPTATGHVFDYYKGAGWVFLHDMTDIKSIKELEL